MAQNNAVPEACDCAKKWVTIGLSKIFPLGNSYFGFSSVTPPPHHILVCALTAAFLDGFLSNCMEVYRGKIYTPIVFGGAAPSVLSFIGSKVIFWWKCVRSAGHIS